MLLHCPHYRINPWPISPKPAPTSYLTSQVCAPKPSLVLIPLILQMISSWLALLKPFCPGQHIALCPEWKKPFCWLSPPRQILCCACLDDGSGAVKECWLLTDHLSLTTTCRLLSPPARATVMDRASIAQPSPPPLPFSILQGLCQSGLWWQLTAWHGRKRQTGKHRNHIVLSLCAVSPLRSFTVYWFVRRENHRCLVIGTVFHLHILHCLSNDKTLLVL